MKIKILFILFFFSFFLNSAHSQTAIGSSFDVDYLTPKEYELGGITVSGADKLDHQVIILLTGLTIGDKIILPGDKISNVIDKLWRQEIFKNVKLSISKIQGNVVFLDLYLEELPRLSRYKFNGVSKSQATKLREQLTLSTGDIVSDNLIINATNKIKTHFESKGYYNVEVNVDQEVDTTSPRKDVTLYFTIKKNHKMKIEHISFEGNRELNAKVLKNAMKDTKEKRIWRFWKSSKYIESDFEKDLDLIVEKYNQLGYRNAKILSDSIYITDLNLLKINIKVFEGQKFYFRNITWVGNSLYTSEDLGKRLRIEKGEAYNKSMLEQNLSYDPSGMDITSMYMDNGYLFFSATPVEVLVENDSIDIQIRIREGKQARISKVSLSGNTTTNDHVIMRELRTEPGQLFSRDDVIRTLNALRTLGYFNQETVHPNIMPNPENETVNIEYQVEEASTSKIELSGGWGYSGLVGTVGLSFTNFSLKNIFNKQAWTPLPAGDGQRLNLNFTTNGTFYYAFNLSFTEPWLGGRRPNALTTSVFYSYRSAGRDYKNTERDFHIGITGASVSLGRRLEWPDDYFTVVNSFSFQQYSTKSYPDIKDGVYNNFNYNIIFGRNSLDALIYPRTGSDLMLSFITTPPYSLFRKNIPENKFGWLEYYKINLKASWMFNLVDNLVLNTRFRMGFLSYYDKKIGLIPFERYYLGGDGLSGWEIDGREIIPMRGYSNASLSPEAGAAVFDKFTLELRYPITLNPTATIWVLGFTEAGYSWSRFKDFNPMQSAVSAGVGVRFFMPFLGTIGFDWGYGFNETVRKGSDAKNKGQIHISINQSID